MAQLNEIELDLLRRGLELLQSAYEAEIDDCTQAEGYEDSEACRRAEICLSYVNELLVKMSALIPERKAHATPLFPCH